MEVPTPTNPANPNPTSIYSKTKRFLLPHATLAHLSPKHIPRNIPEREYQLTRLRESIQGVLHYGAVGCSLLHGPTGTGKTLVARTALREIRAIIEQQATPNIYPIYLDLSQSTTVAMVWSRIIEAVAIDKGFQPRIVKTGISSDEYASRLKTLLRESDTQFILVFDELDKHKDPDSLFRWFTRFNSDNVYWATIVISNDPAFSTKLAPEVQSSLGQPTIIEFPPYDHQELVRILGERAAEVCLPNSISSEAIQYIAQNEAQDRGDARNALDHLKRAVELAERDDFCSRVELDHAQNATALEDHGHLEGYILAMPPNKKLAIASIAYLSHKTNGSEASRWVRTTEAYNHYLTFTEMLGQVDPISRRQFANILDILCRNEHLLDTNLVNRGRGGGIDRHYRITSTLPDGFVMRTLQSDPYSHRIFR